MKIINSSVVPLIQQDGLRGIYKQIELCGRTCYKSEDKITDDSCERFVNAMVKNNHTAMLEHGTVYLTIPDDNKTVPTKYMENPYTKVVYNDAYYITTNYRVIIQNHWEDDLVYLSEPTEYHVKRYTFRIICDRGVSHEIVRHRKMSFAQESTRYCNYSKDKFGNELTFIKPADYTENSQASVIFEANLQYAENAYVQLLNRGWTAQQARAILPNALKTEICVTGFEDDWQHFLDLRYYEKTGKAHPDMKAIATMIYNELKKAEL